MTDNRVVALIRTHLGRYPEAAVQDVYKLLHQATFGPGHAIASKKAAREWLEQESGQITPAAGPLAENIHPDGAIVRLHLRPYLAQQGKLKPLLEAFIRSAELVQGDPAIMQRRWELFETLCQPGGPCAGRFERREVLLFGRVRAGEGWPAVAHSPVYVSAYAPRYRVLARTEAEALCDKARLPFEVI